MIKTYFKEAAGIFFRKKYLEWPEYLDRISKIEHLMFINKTSQESINNYWKKEAKNGSIR
ncbi:MAG: hypothetical protein CMH62_03220 [Nanoarchaeota archaeon]|nr:hypothetical protein [Nanoarchaeota archaeon]|tara:strand:+ start:1026 stop:1205 length:180 start_codon:yes stop_codon:yes gene_type:complete